MNTYDLYKQLASRFITNHWGWIIGFWVVLAVGLRWIAPAWETVAQDGDFQFLPDHLPSRIGQRLLDEAFPAQRARSRLVVIIQRDAADLTNADLAVAFDVGRRLSQLGASNIASRLASNKTDTLSDDQATLQHIKSLLDTSIHMDSQWFDAAKKVAPDDAELLDHRWTNAYVARAKAFEALGDEEHAKLDRDTAALLGASKKSELSKAANPDASVWSSVIDVWTWDDSIIGRKLGASHPNARMLLLQLDNEFMAVGNIKLMQAVEALVEDVKHLNDSLIVEGLSIGISGPPAVGADMMRAAAEGVKQTEWISMLMVLGILAMIYRGPLLVTIPLLTILLSLSVSMSVLALLAKPADAVDTSYKFLQVFTTTKIFLVVLLFGIGTDFCLFLVSRCREGLLAKAHSNRRTLQRVIASSWQGVHDALLGSALTTSIGLLMMYFSDFDKFRYNGLAIGFAIMITLFVCLTFTPALLCAFGRYAFWPLKPSSTIDNPTGQSTATLSYRLWSTIANRIIKYPRTTLFGCLLVLGIPATQGLLHRGWVTYDFLRELSWYAPSREGARLIDKHFSTRDNSPVTVVMVADEPLSEEAMREAINRLRIKLYLPGVTAVRSLTDPLGDYPPDRRMGLFSSDAWKRRMLENHRLTQIHYVAVQDRLAQRAARMDVLVEPDPFSIAAESLLGDIRKLLSDEVKDPESPWYKAMYACTGTTAGISDLKQVTQADQQRIQILVTLGVWAVLFFVLRRPWFSAYLMFTVLLSYLTTLGLTQWFFGWAYGDDFVGLDWKVPLFLFVILVAVGQDYNVYLATRVFEEQSKHGPIQGLFRAMVTTGGIITSCGFVMAATFLSMTGGAVSAWLGEMGVPPWLGGNEHALVLRGIVELGFALGLGVLIDTLVVRTVLVPAMFVWLTRMR